MRCRGNRRQLVHEVGRGERERGRTGELVGGGLGIVAPIAEDELLGDLGGRGDERDGEGEDDEEEAVHLRGGRGGQLARLRQGRDRERTVAGEEVEEVEGGEREPKSERSDRSRRGEPATAETSVRDALGAGCTPSSGMN